MPNSIIQAAAKQLKANSNMLDKLWNAINKKVKANPKYNGYSNARKYAITMSAFIRKSGYKPKSESVGFVLPLIGEMDDFTLASLVKDLGGDVNRVDVVLRPNNTKAIVAWREDVPAFVLEGYSDVMGRSSSFEDKFRSLQSAIYEVASRLRAKLSTYPECTSAQLEKSETDARKIIFKAAEMSESDYAKDEDYLDFFRVMFDDENEGFHVLKAHQINDAISFFYGVYEYDKKLTYQLIREGLMFESHHYLSYKKLIP